MASNDKSREAPRVMRRRFPQLTRKPRSLPPSQYPIHPAPPENKGSDAHGRSERNEGSRQEASGQAFGLRAGARRRGTLRGHHRGQEPRRGGQERPEVQLVVPRT